MLRRSGEPQREGARALLRTQGWTPWAPTRRPMSTMRHRRSHSSSGAPAEGRALLRDLHQRILQTSWACELARQPFRNLPHSTMLSFICMPVPSRSICSFLPFFGLHCNMLKIQYSKDMLDVFRIFVSTVNACLPRKQQRSPNPLEVGDRLSSLGRRILLPASF